MNLNQKYRPKSLDEVLGQDLTINILKKAIENRSFRNSYIFSGTSGTGKTTIARCFAKAINNGVGEPIELDCASNGSVDNIRAIMESASQRSLVGEYKIFILDECQSISSQGWQAFLKGIEETPKYTIFIFCTTEVQKIPATILNRAQHYTFVPIKANLVKERLEYICKQENFTNYIDTCDFISKSCSGSLRDAVTSLEQVADYSADLILDNAKRVLGSSTYESMFKLTWALQQKNSADIMSLIDKFYNDGYDFKTFIDSYIRFTLDIIKYLTFNNIELTNLPLYLATDENPVVQFTVKDADSLNYFNNLLEYLFTIKSAIKFDTDVKSTITLLLLKFIRG